MNKTMFKLGFVLALFAGVACVGLSVVYSLTEERIAAHAKEDLDKALKNIFPDADGDFDIVTQELSSPDELITITEAYAMKKGGNLIGLAVQGKRPQLRGRRDSAFRLYFRACRIRRQGCAGCYS